MKDRTNPTIETLRQRDKITLMLHKHIIRSSLSDLIGQSRQIKPGYPGQAGV